MKFLICLVFLFLISNGFTAKRDANSLIQKYCKQSSKNLETYFYEFCIAALKENHESQKVRNNKEITELGTKNAIANLTKVKSIVEKIVNERKYKSRLSAKLLQDCLKLYYRGYNDLTSGLKYIKVRDSLNFSFSLANAKIAPRMCEMGFNGDNKQISPVKKENDVLYDMINIPYNFDLNRFT
ncbi:Pectinesterase inhibitor 12 [Cardamine amara subsp. amara]|uniref:Pectinesterase inhibitor 12 n=1 Tax=Cardamine amara subsp. amara TaxID=228776 RepID=A0ABD1AR81_CARAN